MKAVKSLLALLLPLVAAAAAAQNIADGVYVIRSAIDQQHVLDLNEGRAYNGGNVQLWTYNGSAAQKWRVTHHNGKLVIHSMVNEKYVLDVSGSHTSSGTNLQVWEWDGSKSQLWTLSTLSNKGGYVINSALKLSLVVNLEHGKLADRTNVNLWRWNFRSRSNSQNWVFDYVGGGGSGDGGGHYEPSMHIIVCPSCGGAGRIIWRNNVICSTCGGAGTLVFYY